MHEMLQRARQMFLNGTFGDAQAPRHFGIGQVFKTVQSKDLLRTPRKLRNHPAQLVHPLAGGEGLFRVCDLTRNFRQHVMRHRIRLPPLDLTHMVDRQVMGRAIKVGPLVLDDGTTSLLGVAQKGILGEVSRHFTVSQPHHQIGQDFPLMGEEQPSQIPD